MESILVSPPVCFSFPSRSFVQRKTRSVDSRFRDCCSPIRSQLIDSPTNDASKSTYMPGLLDDFFLKLFRAKMAEEIGWDSEKSGYAGLIEDANRLMKKGRTNSEIEQSAVKILKSLFPPLLLDLFRMLIAPIGQGKVAAIMVARATIFSCQWLMGPCTLNSVELPDGSLCQSGVAVEKCKYLEESKCVGVCINTCKLPTQTFFKDCMGVPLTMEPNFTDYSCQFKFGVLPPSSAEDKILQEPCLAICPSATRRRETKKSSDAMKCPSA